MIETEGGEHLATDDLTVAAQYKRMTVEQLEQADHHVHNAALERLCLTRAGVFAQLATYHAIRATTEPTSCGCDCNSCEHCQRFEP